MQAYVSVKAVFVTNESRCPPATVSTATNYKLQIGQLLTQKGMREWLLLCLMHAIEPCCNCTFFGTVYNILAGCITRHDPIGSGVRALPIASYVGQK